MPPQHQSENNELLNELESHNEFFDGLVNMIPARLYVAGHSGDDAYNPKYLKGQHKESKEARKARSKIAKRAKFDPEKVETTLETKRRLRQEQEDEEDSDNDSDIVMSDGDGQEDDEDEGNANAADGNKTEAQNEDNFASRIEMLRAKLHAKMSEKRAAAGISAESQAPDGAAAVDTSAPALVSKRAARRAEKMKRKQAAQQRNQKKSSSMAEKKSKEPQRVINLGGSTYNAPTASGKASKKSAAEDLATIDFQSLAGLKPKMDAAFNDKSLNPKTANKKKSLEKLLADAERKQQRLKELKASSDKEDREKAQNIEWGDALKTAEGKNIRKTTDPKLIKKEMKKRAKKKAASAKTWGDRVEQVNEQKDKRQQIRSHNLDARRQGGAVGANLSSKRIKGADDDEDGGAKSKRRRQGPHSDQGRNRAGFEGKKQGFINGDSAGGADKGKQKA